MLLQRRLLHIPLTFSTSTIQKGIGSNCWNQQVRRSHHERKLGAEGDKNVRRASQFQDFDLTKGVYIVTGLWLNFLY
jgi:hypothetical protein